LERRESGTRSEKVSQGQLHHGERFRRAAAYAMAALADPDLRAVYIKKAARKRANPYTMAISNYLKGRVLPSKE
jgi:hypothetical protein